MKLLIEDASDIQFLSEERNGKPVKFFEGVFMQCETVNANKRIYRRDIMEMEVNRYLTERVHANRAWGELGHPSTPTINHERVSHRIISLRLEGNDVIGKAIITETPMGLIARGLLESGGEFGVSSRALGSTKLVEGINVVQKDFKLSTAADIVDDASAPGAKTVRALMENTEWFINEFGQWSSRQQLIEDTVKKTKKLSKGQLEEQTILIANRFFHELIRST
jgi:hypothetical protein